ncbi:hypothetical protein J1N35_044966, partial [Gossypium stocksii]
MAKPLKKLVSCVVLDPDGTLLNIDGVVSEVLKGFLAKYGKQWDGREDQRTVGKIPLEATIAVVEEYGLPCGKEEFLAELHPVFYAYCLLNLYFARWKDYFFAIVGGNEVTARKPSPDIFLEATKRLNRDPSSYLFFLSLILGTCIARPGITGGKAAGMEVVAVPSVPKRAHLYTSADEVINSLLDLQPEKWGLPPFQD